LAKNDGCGEASAIDKSVHAAFQPRFCQIGTRGFSAAFFAKSVHAAFQPRFCQIGTRGFSAAFLPNRYTRLFSRVFAKSGENAPSWGYTLHVAPWAIRILPRAARLALVDHLEKRGSKAACTRPTVRTPVRT